MFSSRNKKNMATFMLKKAPYQELCQNKKERKKNKERSFYRFGYYIFKESVIVIYISVIFSIFNSIYLTLFIEINSGRSLL